MLEPKSTNLRSLLLTSSILVFILIVFGGVLRSSGVDSTCPDWPTCYGSLLPSFSNAAWVDYAHRFLAALSGLFIFVTAFVVWREYPKEKFLTLPLIFSLGILSLQIVLGGFLSLVEEPELSTAIHFGLALSLQGLLLIPTVEVFVENSPVRKNRHLIINASFARMSLWATFFVFLMLFSGTIVTITGISNVCSQWPVCHGLHLPNTPLEWLQFGHVISVLMAGISIVILIYRAWRFERNHTSLLVTVTTTGVLFLGQVLLGSLEAQGEYPPYLKVIHESTAVLIWVTMIVLLALVRLTRKSLVSNHKETTVGRNPRALLKDFFALTKPIVVALLLVTTFAGMVIGGKSWPSLKETFWVLLGGYMAAGGSSAINQFIDREDDLKMQRTQKRPIPSGRLTPSEGLAFGIALTIGSFYLMVANVNLLAALLTLAGILYYVLIYTIFLKKTTVQNIVIGGGAGAIPPLVGWAATTGGINIPALFLFGLIFLWTPPHFWALALVRRKDYARAGVPMLPVVRGQEETRRQILIYTIELVVLTLLLPLFGLGGSIYLISAIVLGFGLLTSAWRVWKQGGNRVAWRMYRHSSMYLAFIFVALMVDALI